MRQWDTKKQFKPRYQLVARVVFLGIWVWLSEEDWPGALRDIGDGLLQLAKHLLTLLFAVMLLIASPVTFPLCCVLERGAAKRRRLAWLRANRRADEDI